jgi:Lipase (class 3)
LTASSSSPQARLAPWLRAEDHETLDHSSLGFLHEGFHFEATTILPRIALMVQGRDYALTGHSLGAALALLHGGLLINDGHPPTKIGVFAPMRIGGEQFVKTVTSVPFIASRFGNDPVPMVPPALEPTFPYRQVPLMQVGQRRFIPFDCHHIDNYVAAFPA